MAKTLACRAGVPGSIPGRGVVLSCDPSENHFLSEEKNSQNLSKIYLKYNLEVRL